MKSFLGKPKISFEIVQISTVIKMHAQYFPSINKQFLLRKSFINYILYYLAK